MTKKDKVVDLRTRCGYQPDYAALARQRVLAARRALDLSAAEFASMLTPLVGWPVSADAVEGWETDSVPPAEVLVAASSAAANDRDGDPLNGGLLASTPPSFSAEALSGHWVTCFQFGSELARKQHIDIAEVSAETDRLMTISNHPPAPRSEGRAIPFRNDLEAQLANRHLIGHWKNSSDARYFGTFHLAILPGETVMAGYYTGFGSDVEVSTGPWKWVRLAADSLTNVDLANVKLRDPVDLGALVQNHSQYDAPLTLTAITEETE